MASWRGSAGRDGKTWIAGVEDWLPGCRRLSFRLPIIVSELDGVAWLGVLAYVQPLTRGIAATRAGLRGSPALTGGSPGWWARVGAESVVVVGASWAWRAERSGRRPELPPLFGRVAGPPPEEREGGASVALGDVVRGVATVPELPGRMADREPPPNADWAPVDRGNCGRNTDRVRPLGSSRSPRVPRLAGVFTSRMPTLRFACGWRFPPLKRGCRG